MSDLLPKHNPYEALQVKDFRYFLAMRFCITLAIQIQSVVVGWLIYEKTGSKLLLGAIGLAEVIPHIGFSFIAGHIVDKVHRKRIIVMSIAALVLCSVLLWLYTLSFAAQFFGPHVYPIYVVIFITGIARSFLGPGMFAFMPQLVGKKQFQNAVTWSSANWHIASVAGPALGGLLYGFAGVHNTFFIQTVLVIMALAFTTMVAARPLPESVKSNAGESMGQRLTEGLRFVFKNKIILNALSLDMFAVLFGGAVALLPVFANDILKIGPQGLGILRAAPALGAVCMTFFLARYPIQYQAGQKMLIAVALFGLAIIGFGLSQWFWLSLLMLFLTGLFDSVSVNVRSTLLQLHTPEHMKGRVSAVNNIFVGSSNELGEFESGITAHWFGTIPAVVFGGSMTLLVVGITSLKAKVLRNLHIE
ncbi:MFS transporter [soil metagenome]